MTEYLTRKQKVALAHKAYPQPLRRDPGDKSAVEIYDKLPVQITKSEW
jgi:hypothetical protein